MSAPTAVSVRSTSVASDLTWLAASEEAVTSVLLGLAGAGGDRLGGGVAGQSTSERWMSAASDLTWVAASADAVTSVFWASRAPASDRLGGGGAGDRQRTLDVGGQRS